MDAQAPKRRKTSSLKATPVLNRNIVDPTSLPRASYLSPTRASLSRFNPSLIPPARAESARSASQNVSATPDARQSLTPDQILAKGQDAFNYIMGNFNTQMQRTLSAISGRTRPSPLSASAAALTTPGKDALGNDMITPIVPTGEETDEQMEAMRSQIRARKEQERAERERAVKSVRSTSLTSPREYGYLPPETMHLGKDQDDDELSVEIGRIDRRHVRTDTVRLSGTPPSAIRPVSELVSAHQPNMDDMDIDPAIDEILQIDELSPDVAEYRSSSRHINKDSAVRQSNPLLRRLATEEEDELPETPEAIRRQFEAEDHPPRGVLFSSPRKRKAVQGTRKSPRKSSLSSGGRGGPDGSQKPQIQEPEGTTKSENTQTRHVEEPDPRLLARQETKTRLDAELRRLKEEVEKFEYFAKLYTEKNEDDLENMESVIELFNSIHRKDADKTPEPSLSSLLTSFLPFSVPVSRSLKESEHSKNEDFIISHQPLKEKEPLPLSSLFTPLNIESNTSSPVPVPDSHKLRQKHSVVLSSPGSLLTCSLDVTIISEHGADSTPSVENLVVKDLSFWAKEEIGTWIDQKCKEGDLAAVGYGLGRYWDVAVKRARCWMVCRKEFAKFVPGDSLVDDETVKSDEVDLGAEHTKLSKKALLSTLGLSSLILQNEEVVLKIPWRLQFDWTGDVESIISAEASFPASWHETDSGNALRRIPRTFEALLRDGGVTSAVKVVGKLVFDTQ
ncbi:uncharacterized protein PV09_01041 [Verruconis gallopava]|uniref:Uncharacterized protein n=1 Tax=Verruconis gallopava TaxID=253628 RepID=A0A0D2AN18_9PEZI|nr:uncharacterized protein PV09_01041 [Verruconis gallopava]KIW08103.1 hypothetical protein PV09_01041 [Verruconis gallopava]